MRTIMVRHGQKWEREKGGEKTELGRGYREREKDGVTGGWGIQREGGVIYS